MTRHETRDRGPGASFACLWTPSILLSTLRINTVASEQNLLYPTYSYYYFLFSCILREHRQFEAKVFRNTWFESLKYTSAKISERSGCEYSAFLYFLSVLSSSTSNYLCWRLSGLHELSDSSQHTPAHFGRVVFSSIASDFLPGRQYDEQSYLDTIQEDIIDTLTLCYSRVHTTESYRHTSRCLQVGHREVGAVTERRNC